MGTTNVKKSVLLKKENAELFALIAGGCDFSASVTKTETNSELYVECSQQLFITHLGLWCVFNASEPWMLD